MKKFDTDFAEMLYSETPDDQAEDSDQGDAWYGLYSVERIILVEGQNGYVTTHEYDSTDELNAAWEEIVLELSAAV